MRDEPVLAVDGVPAAGTLRRCLRRLLPACLFILAGCSSANVQTYAFGTLEEGRKAGAVEQGWIPEGLPPGSREIRVAQVPGTSRHWGIVNFPPAEREALERLFEPGEVSLTGEYSGMPARVEWWPVLLRGRLDGDRLASTGLRGYRARAGGLLFAVNWNQGRAYYWRAGER